jgi:hypothetical protein
LTVKRRVEADGHTVLSCQFNDLLKTPTGSSLNNDEPFDGSCLSLETLENRMDAEDDLHRR